MGWERGYYYRAKKVNGRVVREYIGRGEFAEIAAEIDALSRTERKAKADTESRANAEAEALDKLLAELCERTDLLARAALVAAGYRQHKRGDWRRKRVQRHDSQRTDSQDGRRNSPGNKACRS